MSEFEQWMAERFVQADLDDIINRCASDPVEIDYFAILHFEPYDANRQRFRICVRAILKDLLETL